MSYDREHFVDDEAPEVTLGHEDSSRVPLAELAAGGEQRARPAGRVLLVELAASVE